MKENTVSVVELTEVEEINNTQEIPFLQGKNLDLIQDLPVQLEVKLGSFNTSVDNLYQLKEGSLVQLTTKVDEPVKIYLGENIVAEGIIVAVDEHYAIEITNLAQLTN